MSRIDFINNNYTTKEDKKLTPEFIGTLWGINVYKSDAIKPGESVFINDQGKFSVFRSNSQNPCIGRIVSMEPDGTAIVDINGEVPQAVRIKIEET